MLSNTLHRSIPTEFRHNTFAQSSHTIKHHLLHASSRLSYQAFNHIFATLDRHRKHIKKLSSTHRASSLRTSSQRSSHNTSSQTQKSVQKLVLMFTIIDIKSSMFNQSPLRLSSPKSSPRKPDMQRRQTCMKCRTTAIRYSEKGKVGARNGSPEER
jgi:hypothetical protein